MSEMIDQRKHDLNEIAIVIDSWDDVFSDFDPRPLSQRTLSEDFIEEMKRRYRETRTGEFSITIYLPDGLRNANSEKMVRQRLKKHFHHQALLEQKYLTQARLRGALYMVMGVCSLGVLTLLIYSKTLSELHTDLIGIILMPIGWFGIWEGFSKLVDISPTAMFRKGLSEKFARARFTFKSLGGEK